MTDCQKIQASRADSSESFYKLFVGTLQAIGGEKEEIKEIKLASYAPETAAYKAAIDTECNCSNLSFYIFIKYVSHVQLSSVIFFYACVCYFASIFINLKLRFSI